MMNLQRVIRDVTTTVTRSSTGFEVQVTTAYVESSIGGGKMKKCVDRYEKLSREELIDVLENVADGPMAGDPFYQSEQTHLLFTLS